MISRRNSLRLAIALSLSISTQHGKLLKIKLKIPHSNEIYVYLLGADHAK
jgi:hypothetical protein